MQNETEMHRIRERDANHYTRRYQGQRSDPAQQLFEYMGNQESPEHWKSPGLRDGNTRRKITAQTNLKPGHQS